MTKRGHTPKLLLLLRLYGISTAAGLLAAAVLLLTAAAAMSILQLDTGLAPLLAEVIFAGSCLVGAYTAGRISGKSGLSVGISAALPLLLLWLIGAAMLGGLSMGSFAAKSGVLLIAGVAGGVRGVAAYRRSKANRNSVDLFGAVPALAQQLSPRR